MQDFNKIERAEISHRLLSRYKLRVGEEHSGQSKVMSQKLARSKMESALRSMQYIGLNQKPDDLEIFWILVVTEFLWKEQNRNWNKQIIETSLANIQEKIEKFLPEIEPRFDHEPAEFQGNSAETIQTAFQKIETTFEKKKQLQGLSTRWKPRKAEVKEIDPRLNKKIHKNPFESQITQI